MKDTSDKVNMPHSGWKFDAKVTDVFDDHVRQSVPLYDHVHSLIADLSCWFVSHNTNVYDIGTSTGQALENISALHPYKSVTFIGFDNSHDMISKARERFRDRNDITIMYGNVIEDAVELRNASYITSILTLQFVVPSERQRVVDKIYNGLNVGGAFVLVEKVIGSTTRFDQMYIELYHELKMKNGLSLEHVQNKMRSLRGVQRPNTIEENSEMLKRAGFKEIDIFFKWCNFAGFIATK